MKNVLLLVLTISLVGMIIIDAHSIKTLKKYETIINSQEETITYQENVIRKVSFKKYYEHLRKEEIKKEEESLND